MYLRGGDDGENIRCEIQMGRDAGNKLFFRPGRLTTSSGEATGDNNGKIYLGSSSRRWKEIWCTQNSLNSSSDRNLKNTIEYMGDEKQDFFMKLKPCSFKYNDGESDRKHFGFISQDVEQAMIESGMSSLDFAGFIKFKKKETLADDTEVDVLDENGKPIYEYGLRYSEFISLNTYMIQQQQKKIKEQEEKINELEERLAKIEELLK
jgi:hypothetical protein